MSPILRAHRKLLGTMLGMSVLFMAFGVALPRVTMAAIDRALVPPPAERAALAPYVTAMVVLGVLRFVTGFFYRYNLQQTSLAIEFDLRNLLYEHFTRLSFSFYDRVQTGQLISRANSDIRSVQLFLAFAPAMGTSVLMFVAAFTLMATIHLPLALLAVSTLPLVYFGGLRMRSVMFPISWVVQARQADVATIVEENVTGVRVVKAFAAEEGQVKLLARAAERLRWAATLQVENRARWSPVLQNLPRLALAGVLLYGGWLAIRGDVTIGTLVAFNAYVVMLQMPFMMLGFLMMMAQRAAASADRIFEILDSSPDVVDRPGAVDLVDCAGAVEFDEVRFGYADNPDILRGLRLRLDPGETVAMVGRTGSGKSTVARLLPRFYDVRAGAVRVDGRDVRDLTLASLRANVGLVLDEPFLFSDTIRANIAFSRPDAPLEEVEAAARAAGAHEFITSLPEGYDSVIGERGYTLSGGQRQRVAIARTLLANPPILILDDATSSIDVQVELEIHEALRTLMKGRTTLIIAHRLSTISLADRVVLLQDGRITADGTHAELMATVPAYAEVLAHAEEEWAAAHAEQPPAELPPWLRAMQRLAAARGGNGPSPETIPGMS